MLARSLVGSMVLVSALAYADVPPVCGGNSALLAWVDRPTIGDSACTVPNQKVLLEIGYQYQALKTAGNGFQLPQTELRIGLPSQTEFVLLPMNYIHQSQNPRAGVAAAVVGLKHEVAYASNWLATAEAIMTLPSGSRAYGSQSAGAAVNGIIAYSLNPVWSVSVMAGVSSQTLPVAVGGARYNSFNPDVVITAQLSPKVQALVEVYGQSRTAPHAGAGFNADAGVLYLITQNTDIDFELGQRISGNLGNFNHYIGVGLATLL